MKRYLKPVFKSILFLLTYAIFRGLINIPLNKFTNGPLNQLPASSAFMAAIITLLIFLHIERKKLDYIDIHFDTSGRSNFAKGMLKGFKYSLLITAILCISFEVVFSGFIKNDMNLFSVIILGIINLLLMACFQELLYRGYILHYLKYRFSISGAVIISSLIFAAAQSFSIYATPLTFLNNFLAGCILSIFVLKYDSLEYALGLHFTWDIIMYLIFSFSRGGGENQGIYNLSYKNIEMLNGGSYGPEGGLIFTFATLILILYFYKKLDRKRSFFVSRKSLCLSLILLAAAAVYVIYDGLIWYPEAENFSHTPIKSMGRLHNVNDYTLDWKLEMASKKIQGNEEVDYINTSSDNLKKVYFHMYAAAFKEYGGGIKIKRVTVNGEDAKFSIEGSDGTLLNIPLKEVLNSGSRVKINLEYTIDIPRRSNNGFADRFAYSNNAINLGNCFPIAAVYEKGSWDKHLYDKKGDAFYSETSNFQAKITAPEDYILAVTGIVDNTKIKGKEKIWSITANGVRDFALTASNKFKVAEGNVNGTIVKSYAFNKYKAQKVLNISRDAIMSFNKRFGEYPYPTCSVVETDLNGGMEYPTMVMILSTGYDNININDFLSKIFYKSAIGELEFTVVHELAHQWWYGLVGNDEFREAWIDEPLTQFSSLLYYRDKYGKDYFESIYTRSIANLYNIEKTSIKSPDFKRPLNQFEDNEYTALIYARVPMLIKKYYDAVGDEKFNDVLRAAFRKYEFKVLKGEDYPIPLETN